MHLCIVAVVVFSVWKQNEWKNWKLYHSTMLYFITANLLYFFFSSSHLLWVIQPDILTNYVSTQLLYLFVVLPGTTILFLSKHPNTFQGVIKHYLFWYLAYIGVESLWVYCGRINYQNGWNLFWSSLFVIVMFPMLYLHSKKPLTAYILSIPIIVFLIYHFDVPVNIPLGER